MHTVHSDLVAESQCFYFFAFTFFVLSRTTHREQQHHRKQTQTIKSNYEYKRTTPSCMAPAAGSDIYMGGWKQPRKWQQNRCTFNSKNKIEKLK